MTAAPAYMVVQLTLQEADALIEGLRHRTDAASISARQTIAAASIAHRAAIRDADLDDGDGPATWTGVPASIRTQ